MRLSVNDWIMTKLLLDICILCRLRKDFDSKYEPIMSEHALNHRTTQVEVLSKYTFSSEAIGKGRSDSVLCPKKALKHMQHCKICCDYSPSFIPGILEVWYEEKAWE